MSQVRLGDLVQIHYTGRLTDGTVFDSSGEEDPLEFTAGSEDLITGVSDAVLGMAEGEKKTVTISPEQGFGVRNPSLEYQVPRSALPPDAQVGDQLSATAGKQRIRLWVREMREQVAVVDANHPLAGQTLIFDIELVSIQPQQR